MNMLTLPILVAFVFGVVVCDDDDTMALVGILPNLVQDNFFIKFSVPKGIFSKLLVLLSKQLKAVFLYDIFAIIPYTSHYFIASIFKQFFYGGKSVA